jgi:hypothetical protein
LNGGHHRPGGQNLQSRRAPLLHHAHTFYDRYWNGSPRIGVRGRRRSLLRRGSHGSWRYQQHKARKLEGASRQQHPLEASSRPMGETYHLRRGWKSSRHLLALGMATARGSEARAHAELRLRKKLVFFDNSGNGHFAVRYPVLHTNDPTLALHSDAFGQRDLRGQSQGEGNG